MNICCRFERLFHVVREDETQLPDPEVGVDAHAEPAALVVRARLPTVASADEDAGLGEHQPNGSVQGHDSPQSFEIL